MSATNKKLALTLARNLLNVHGHENVPVLVSKRATRRAGAVKTYADGRMELHLSEWLLTNAKWEEMENTVRHEVAHVIAGHKAGHGPKWKKIAKELGCTGERCYGEELAKAAPKGRYEATCRCSGKVYRRHKLAKHLREQRGRCPNCRTLLVFLDTKTHRYVKG